MTPTPARRRGMLAALIALAFSLTPAVAYADNVDTGHGRGGGTSNGNGTGYNDTSSYTCKGSRLATSSGKILSMPNWPGCMGYGNGFDTTKTCTTGVLVFRYYGLTGKSTKDIKASSVSRVNFNTEPFRCQFPSTRLFYPNPEDAGVSVGSPFKTSRKTSAYGYSYTTTEQAKYGTNAPLKRTGTCAFIPEASEITGRIFRDPTLPTAAKKAMWSGMVKQLYGKYFKYGSKTALTYINATGTSSYSANYPDHLKCSSPFDYTGDQAKITPTTEAVVGTCYVPLETPATRYPTGRGSWVYGYKLAYPEAIRTDYNGVQADPSKISVTTYNKAGFPNGTTRIDNYHYAWRAQMPTLLKALSKSQQPRQAYSKPVSAGQANAAKDFTKMAAQVKKYSWCYDSPKATALYPTQNTASAPRQAAGEVTVAVNLPKIFYAVGTGTTASGKPLASTITTYPAKLHCVGGPCPAGAKITKLSYNVQVVPSSRSLKKCSSLAPGCSYRVVSAPKVSSPIQKGTSETVAFYVATKAGQTYEIRISGGTAEYLVPKTTTTTTTTTLNVQCTKDGRQSICATTSTITTTSTQLVKVTAAPVFEDLAGNLLGTGTVSTKRTVIDAVAG